MLRTLLINIFRNSWKTRPVYVFCMEDGKISEDLFHHMRVATLITTSCPGLICRYQKINGIILVKRISKIFISGSKR
jgi:hypothetical protein